MFRKCYNRPRNRCLARNTVCHRLRQQSSLRSPPPALRTTRANTPMSSDSRSNDLLPWIEELRRRKLSINHRCLVCRMTVSNWTGHTRNQSEVRLRPTHWRPWRMSCFHCQSDPSRRTPLATWTQKQGLLLSQIHPYYCRPQLAIIRLRKAVTPRTVTRVTVSLKKTHMPASLNWVRRRRNSNSNSAICSSPD